MGAIDYSNWFQPIPQSPTARGLGSLSTALDAIIARRQQQKQHEAEQQGLMLRNQQDNERALQASTMQAESARLATQQREAAAAAAAEQQRQRLSLDQQKMRNEAWGKANDIYRQPGGDAVAEQLLAGAGVLRPVEQRDLPPVDFVKEDDSPMGFSVTPEWEAQQGAVGKMGVVGQDDRAIPFAGPPTPEVLARRLRQQFGHVAGDPRLNAALSDAEAGVASGAIRPDRAYSETLGAERGRISAEKRAAMSGRQTISPGENARLNRMAVSDLSSDVARWQQDRGYDEISKTLRDLKQAESEIKEHNAIMTTGVRYSIGRKIAGPGVFTEGEQAAILGRVGGEIERWDQLRQTFENGQLTPTQEKIFVDAIKAKLRYTLKSEAAALTSNFDEGFLGPGSPYAGMEPNVLNQRNRLFQPFGVPRVKVEGQAVQVMPGTKGRTTPTKPKTEASSIVDRMMKGKR